MRGDNHFSLAETATDDVLSNLEWNRAERCARMLEDYMRHQPQPWGTFKVERGRVLAAWNRSGPGGDLAG
jgi:hypothetical protein